MQGINDRIVFMGTPDFAVESLAGLLENKLNVIAVVTAPDKPAGRGMQLQQSAVKKFALSQNLPVLQPPKLKAPEFIEELRRLHAGLQVVVAFRMLPEVVWNMPPMGTINLHASLLPKYRGAAPINWAIINGETQTGLTTFKLKHEIDTGDILQQVSMEIGENETAGELHDRMKIKGAELLATTVKALLAGNASEKPQSAFEESGLQHAPKIFTETCRIHWQLPVDSIHNLIRGLSPFPAAFTTLHGKTLKIFRSNKEQVTPGLEPGQWISDYKHYLKFAAADGFIEVLELQMEGKKRMEVAEFLRGFRG